MWLNVGFVRSLGWAELSTSWRLIVGGIVPSRTTKAQKALSSAPAAPSRWPVAPLVEDTNSGRSRCSSLPNTSSMAFISIASPELKALNHKTNPTLNYNISLPNGVEVACALIYPISEGLHPANLKAESMLLLAPLPDGSGAVAWLASALSPYPVTSQIIFAPGIRRILGRHDSPYSHTSLPGMVQFF
jgi:hypothetical protein